MKRILLVSEFINPPYDEGIKKTVYNLYKYLNKKYKVKVITRYGFEDKNIYIIKSNKLFFSLKTRVLIKKINPDIIIYLPFSSATFPSYLRNKILSSYKLNAKNIFIALQPKRMHFIQNLILKFIKPGLALTQSPDLKKIWDRYNIRSIILPAITDLNIFKPILNFDNKQKLLVKYNLPRDKCIITHIGHLNKTRNLESLIPLQNDNNQVVIILSSSTPSDAIGPISLKEKLISSGIIIIDKYIANIEEIYQLSDFYVFPVISKTGSISLPLSVLEAHACNIPVITTNYGSLKLYFNNNSNIIFSKTEHFSNEINNYKKTEFVNSIKQINNSFYKIIDKAINN